MLRPRCDAPFRRWRCPRWTRGIPVLALAVSLLLTATSGILPGLTVTSPTPTQQTSGPITPTIAPGAAGSATYPVQWEEVGLPAQTLWWVELENTSYQAVGNTISVSEPNGSIEYVAGDGGGLFVFPDAGTIRVDGSPVTVRLDFSSHEYRVVFWAQHEAPSDPWAVRFGAVTQSSDSASLPVNMTDGSWRFSVEPPDGFLVSPQRGDVVVNGSGSVIMVDFAPSPPGSAAEFPVIPPRLGPALEVVGMIAFGGAVVWAVPKRSRSP